MEITVLAYFNEGIFDAVGLLLNADFLNVILKVLNFLKLAFYDSCFTFITVSMFL